MKEKIYKIIKERSPIKRANLLYALRYYGYNITDRQLRKEVELLITHDGKCIASSQDGYSIIESMQDLEDAMKYMRKKALPILTRAKHLHKNFTKDKGIQISFSDFFDE